ncbi:RNA polymerase subunit sigma [Halarcobacter mediterraneus]|uniref:RNA polymerase subunit sigma n=1 Tax=Halarcobacter mediterraneus TaxID=2023153 RepID=A0A4Q1AW09_9BACT|nr:sigma-70 family RNA polymerase sigma factor [Halarcobacter mediterraneus]RXK12152.1 RNA polymerase subunit sigma [Halarcobacter mediterraneus]
MLKYYDELLYYAYKLVGDKERAKDIVQETYSRVLEIKDNRKIKNQRAYLYKVVKHIAVDESIEEQKLKSTIFQEDITLSIKTEQPEEIAIKQNQEEIFMQIVNELPQRTKEAFVLFTVDGYTRKEIAKMMDITSNAVEKLIKRATIKIEDELSKKGF